MRLYLMSAAILAVPALASADTYFSPFVVPATFGSAGSTYQEWNGFTSPAGPNAATALSNSTGTPNAYDASAATDGSLMAGAHIYASTGASSPTVTFSTPTTTTGYTEITAQVDTLGTELNLAGITITPTGGTAVAPRVTTLLAQSSLGGMGVHDDYKFIWDIPAGSSAFTLVTPAASANMSWAGTRVDTAAVATPVSIPEPASIGLVLAGVALVARRSRKA